MRVMDEKDVMLMIEDIESENILDESSGTIDKT